MGSSSKQKSPPIRLVLFDVFGTDPSRSDAHPLANSRHPLHPAPAGP
jgi:hypothetical protein